VPLPHGEMSRRRMGASVPRRLGAGRAQHGGGCNRGSRSQASGFDKASMSFEKSRGRRGSLNFERKTRAFDESAAPKGAVQAKQEVLDAKKPDILGVGKPGWNNSVACENMSRFPDRTLMRQLSKFDSIKRADYNFRGEQLDWKDQRMYVPTPNKFEFNERHDASAKRLSMPPALSRTEFPVHSALISKTRWDSATGHGGDPYAAEKAHEAKGAAMLQFALENSARRQPKRRECLIHREERFQQEARAAKAERLKAEARGEVWQPPPRPLSGPDALEMTRQVPVLKTTTWSLAGF